MYEHVRVHAQGFKDLYVYKQYIRGTVTPTSSLADDFDNSDRLDMHRDPTTLTRSGMYRRLTRSGIHGSPIPSRSIYICVMAAPHTYICIKRARPRKMTTRSPSCEMHANNLKVGQQLVREPLSSMLRRRGPTDLFQQQPLTRARRPR